MVRVYLLNKLSAELGMEKESVGFYRDNLIETISSCSEPDFFKNSEKT